MKFLGNLKLATRISIITTVITFGGMLLLWLIVSNRVSTIPIAAFYTFYKGLF